MIDKFSLFLKNKLGEKYGKIVENSTGILGFLALFKFFALVTDPQGIDRAVSRRQALYNTSNLLDSVQIFGFGLLDILIFVCIGVIIWAIYKGLNSKK
ncbi:MAG: hypothetical protein Q4A21_00395 [bacterium]|nr:hypothetical protein [bacterium]